MRCRLFAEGIVAAHYCLMVMIRNLTCTGVQNVDVDQDSTLVDRA
jgi:hypothetical protein